MTDSIPRSVRDAGSHVLEALLRLAADDVEVRRSLATVNAWLARELSQRAGASAGVTGGEREERDVLTPRAPHAPAEPHRPVDLATIFGRADWKAEALRHAVLRRQPAPEGGAAAHEAELRAAEADLRKRQAAAGGPWAWMLDAPPSRAEPEQLLLLAETYTTVAHVAKGLRVLEQEGAFELPPPVELLRLVAEAQSALLAALAGVGLRQDEDQRDLFQWLRDQTTRHRIYVDRHMRLGDPADPALSADLRTRFDDALERTRRLGLGRKERGQLLNKVRYHVRKLLDGGPLAGDDRTALAESEWKSLGAALESWSAHGLDLADRELRDLLSPFTSERVADLETTPALRAALPQPPAEERVDPLEQVRPLLADRSVLMITESEDDEAREALRSALDLATLEWLALESEGGEERIARVAKALAADGLELVLMGMRLPQDEYIAFKARCVEASLPFVRLPGTLEPQAVAHQTLRQVGWRLREAAGETR